MIVDRYPKDERSRLLYMVKMGQEIIGSLQLDDFVLFGLARTVRRIEASIQLISECCAIR